MLGTGEGSLVIDWATLYVQRMPDGIVEKIAIGTDTPRATDFDVVLEWSTYEALAFVRPDAFTLRSPASGKLVELALPISGPITTC